MKRQECRFPDPGGETASIPGCMHDADAPEYDGLLSFAERTRRGASLPIQATGTLPLPYSAQ
ncbi:MAG: hypothetical protein IJR99_03540 [Kiritimatiellae bacterium]|nr:hypothetical protein [Kiritimatiellia bacterium]